MSDVAQGPDWWLASDGKWYPPASRSHAPPPPQARPTNWTPPPRLSALLTGWVQGLLWLCAALGAVAVILGVAAVSRFDAWWDAPASADQAEFDAWLSVDEAWGVTGLLALVLTLATAVLFMVWMHRAHRISAWLNPRPRSWTQGWTVGGWFIPLANLVIPKLVLNEIERLATDVRRGLSPGAAWQKLPTMPIGWVWWLSWMGSLVFSAVSSGMLDSVTEASRFDPGQVRALYYTAAIGDALWVVAAVSAVVYVRALTALLTSD